MKAKGYRGMVLYSKEKGDLVIFDTEHMRWETYSMDEINTERVYREHETYAPYKGNYTCLGGFLGCFVVVGREGEAYAVTAKEISSLAGALDTTIDTGYQSFMSDSDLNYISLVNVLKYRMATVKLLDIPSTCEETFKMFSLFHFNITLLEDWHKYLIQKGMCFLDEDINDFIKFKLNQIDSHSLTIIDRKLRCSDILEGGSRKVELIFKTTSIKCKFIYSSVYLDSNGKLYIELLTNTFGKPPLKLTFAYKEDWEFIECSKINHNIEEYVGVFDYYNARRLMKGSTTIYTEKITDKTSFSIRLAKILKILVEGAKQPTLKGIMYTNLDEDAGGALAEFSQALSCVRGNFKDIQDYYDIQNYSKISTKTVKIARYTVAKIEVGRARTARDNKWSDLPSMRIEVFDKGQLILKHTRFDFTQFLSDADDYTIAHLFDIIRAGTFSYSLERGTSTVTVRDEFLKELDKCKGDLPMVISTYMHYLELTDDGEYEFKELKAFRAMECSLNRANYITVNCLFDTVAEQKNMCDALNNYVIIPDSTANAIQLMGIHAIYILVIKAKSAQLALELMDLLNEAVEKSNELQEELNKLDDYVKNKEIHNIDSLLFLNLGTPEGLARMNRIVGQPLERYISNVTW